MRFITFAFCLLAFAFPAPLLGQETPGRTAPEIVAAVRIQGNQIAGDAEVISLAGVTIGAPVTPSLFPTRGDSSVEEIRHGAVLSGLLHQRPTQIVVDRRGGGRLQVPKDRAREP